jgi:hypothetical protein
MSARCATQARLDAGLFLPVGGTAADILRPSVDSLPRTQSIHRIAIVRDDGGRDSAADASTRPRYSPILAYWKPKTASPII